MFRRNWKGGSKQASDVGLHGERPWVYFMIDSFFLMNLFFVLTFRMKTGDDVVLPQKFVQPGCPGPRERVVVPVAIAVNRDSSFSTPTYRINGGEKMDVQTLNTRLVELSAGRDSSMFSVRIAYDGKVIFDDVMPILNTCVHLKITQCGLQPTREKI